MEKSNQSPGGRVRYQVFIRRCDADRMDQHRLPNESMSSLLNRLMCAGISAIERGKK